MLQRLVQLGGRLEARDEQGATPLIRAAAAGLQDLTGALLLLGADVNAVTDTVTGGERGESALMLAAQGGHLGVVSQLCQWHADHSLQGPQGIPPATRFSS